MTGPRFTALAGPLSRRAAVRLGMLTGGGLIVACKTAGASRARLAGEEPTAAPPARSEPLVSWIQITPDNLVKYFMPWTEMGQGLSTGLAALIGEELDVDPAEILVVYAGANSLLPDTPDYQPGATGGSSGMSSTWTPLRQAAAAAREMLVAAAAADWGVAVGACSVANKRVAHAPTGRSATFGSLAKRAAALPPPRQPALKAASAFKYIGKAMRRIDLGPKVDGSAAFGIDVIRPNMVNATIVHCPLVGGSLGHLDDAAARAANGVIAVVPTPFGVAVVADTFWHASQGARLLKITWTPGPNPGLSSDGILAEQKSLVEAGGLTATEAGDFDAAFAGAAKKVEAYYQVPYLPHSTLEPQNCTVDIGADGTCEIWTPTQDPGSARDVAVAITGFDKAKVKVHVTLGGGGFGRRLRQDVVSEAVHVGLAVKRPVKLLWTRPEEFIRDFYRPASYNKVQAGLDAGGVPVAWQHRIASSSITAWLAEDAVITPAKQTEADSSATEGAAQLLYAMPNIRVAWSQHEPGVPVSWWRSVGYSHNTWVVESFIDELAHAAGKDPLQYRLGLLADDRLKHLLQLAADKAGWATPPPPGSGRGCAIARCFGTTVAEVCEVAVKGTSFTVTRVVAVVDCGTAVNPFLVQTQVQGAIIQALSAALHWEITLAGGRVQQRSFAFADRGQSQGGCPMLAFSETPVIDVYLALSGEAPGGIGEPGVPPLAPALCNAIFAACGQRIRKLPVVLA